MNYLGALQVRGDELGLVQRGITQICSFEMGRIKSGGRKEGVLQVRVV